jgi:hypothetical protein
LVFIVRRLERRLVLAELDGVVSLLLLDLVQEAEVISLAVPELF